MSIHPKDIYDEAAYERETALFDEVLNSNPETFFPSTPTPVPETVILRPEDEAELLLEKAVGAARVLLQLSNNSDPHMQRLVKYGETTLEMYREKLLAAQHLEAPDSLASALVDLANKNAAYIQQEINTPHSKPTIMSLLSNVFKR